jgi:hypothetical protein
MSHASQVWRGAAGAYKIQVHFEYRKVVVVIGVFVCDDDDDDDDAECIWSLLQFISSLQGCTYERRLHNRTRSEQVTLSGTREISWIAAAAAAAAAAHLQ